MCSTINMDQQQQYVQSTSGTGGQSGDVVVGSARELPPDISQMDFQTIKAASDTLKVSDSSNLDDPPSPLRSIRISFPPKTFRIPNYSFPNRIYWNFWAI